MKPRRDPQLVLGLPEADPAPVVEVGGPELAQVVTDFERRGYRWHRMDVIRNATYRVHFRRVSLTNPLNPRNPEPRKEHP